jgi:hypothetical protein
MVSPGRVRHLGDFAEHEPVGRARSTQLEIDDAAQPASAPSVSMATRRDDARRAGVPRSAGQSRPERRAAQQIFLSSTAAR